MVRNISLFQQNFEKGTISVFNIGVSNKIGSILRLRVWHDSGGGQPSWHLDKIVIKDTWKCKRYSKIHLKYHCYHYHLRAFALHERLA